MRLRLTSATAPSRKAIFVDTDRLPARDSRVGDLVQNIGEATLIHQVSQRSVQVPAEASLTSIMCSSHHLCWPAVSNQKTSPSSPPIANRSSSSQQGWQINQVLKF